MPAPTRLNWDDLRIFLEVNRSKTLTAAARQLRIDDSTVSRRIAALEASLNETLFIRDSAGLHPTPRGLELLMCVQDMERGALAITEPAIASDRTPCGHVRVATMEGIASLYLAAEFVALRERYPLLEVELVTSSNQVQVNRREADIFISFFPTAGRGLAVTEIGAFQLHLYASPEYLARAGTPHSVDDLTGHDFVSYVDDLVQLDTVRWLREGVPNPRVVFHSSSMLAQMFAAGGGAGIVMLPTFARAERFGLVPVLGRRVEVGRMLFLAVHKELQHTPRVKAVCEFLQEIIARDYPRNDA
ncbi:LysR family transcriptional regulator [Cupriavidus pampae]|uniref:HTH-type transcriptional regulator GltC n=1 Tax=Cupriavidus pampae TaxID=659251 RepID=A0ABN7YEH5_9BURK|nr:LysR family transcriptional regulator [Cupriavidus pampae]CAG9171819.1 HTH-type transcriptional regulator GltC [Cupriavidus pampae]